MTDFAALEPQDVREYWTHEEHDFTPWLANDIQSEGASELENALGLDLEVVEREKRVGKYKVDIFARVLDDGRNVVIENQLADSDHDHLGKAIAYAAGVDADIIIWIAPKFNDEHLDAVQWLNENSREGVGLSAVRLEVWRIADSPPAVRLNPVEKPSEWKEKAKRTKGELSETKQLQEEFWTEFRDRIEARETPLRARKPKPEYKYANPIGIGGAHIAFGLLIQEDQIFVTLTIEDDEDAFRELQAQQDEIEEALGFELIWDEPEETTSGRMRSHIWVTHSAAVEDRSQWDEYIEWLIETGEKFHEVFPERLRDL